LVIIKHNKEVKTKPNGEPKESKNKDVVKIVPFRSIQKCWKTEYDRSLVKIPKGWEHTFALQTQDRQYILFAPTNEERIMWMTGFKYAIASTAIVQDIMK
jgi:hypothetical protein